MKENKKFFYNNRLNKGYKKIQDNQSSDFDDFKKQNLNILPPIDMMEEYEEKHPGTFNLLMSMAQKEQKHRHEMELLEIQKYNNIAKYGRIFAIWYIIIISITSIALLENVNLAVIFIVCAFATILCVSYVFTRNRTNQYIRPRYNKNYKKP